MLRRIGMSVAGAAILCATSAQAMDKCKVKVDKKTGVLLVSATGVSGTLLWGSTDGEAKSLSSTRGNAWSPTRQTIVRSPIRSLWRRRRRRQDAHSTWTTTLRPVRRGSPDVLRALALRRVSLCAEMGKPGLGRTATVWI